ncbi:hypothetical protein PMAYCL1PPCAC_26988, partial [Pristionchus mayeri]
IIMSILSKTTMPLEILLLGQLQLNDPAAFVQALNSSSVSRVDLSDRRDNNALFFDIPRTFCERFLNENLSNGSFEWVEVNIDGKEITQGPINLPESPITDIEWKKADSKKVEILPALVLHCERGVWMRRISNLLTFLRFSMIPRPLSSFPFPHMPMHSP